MFQSVPAAAHPERPGERHAAGRAGRRPTSEPRARELLAQVGLARAAALHLPPAPLAASSSGSPSPAPSLTCPSRCCWRTRPTGNLDSKTGETVIELLLLSQPASTTPTAGGGDSMTMN